ncbi:MAG: right-handed parallel beta-helix repeat-containing protein, partial [bacterium]|nr:right-handed parallel beta-helix repeat-containing protein [bacterium]
RQTLYAVTDGAVLLNNSQHCEVKNNYITQCARGIMVAGTSDYCTVEDNFIEKSFAYASSNYWYATPIFSVANYATIRRNEIDGLITFYDDSTLVAGQGIALEIQNYPNYYCYGAQIYRNEVRNVAWWGIRCQQFITNTGIQAVDINVYENYIHDSAAPGAGTGEEDGIAFGCNAGDAYNHFTGVNVYRNVIYNFVNSGVIVCNYWDDADIYGNLIGKVGYDGAGGIYLSTATLKDCNIYNNTLYDCRHDGIVCYGAYFGGQGVKINNNIITDVSFTQSGHGKAVFVSANAAPYVSGGYNCFYDIDGSPTTLNFTNTNGITSDPSFCDSAAGNFHLGDSSLCIGAGTDVDLDYDLDYNAITGTADIGCYKGISYSQACYLKMDEGSGFTAYDETANANDGTLSAALDTSTCWVDAAIDKGVSFTSSNWNKYIDCGNDASLNGLSNYTVCAWVKADSSGSGTGNRYVIMKYGGSTLEGFMLRLESNNNIAFYQVANGVVWNANLVLSTAFPHDGLFHHVAATFSYDGTTIADKLYIDGILCDSGSDTLVPDISTSLSTLRIGGGVFNGILDEAKVYGRVLTEKEIWAISRMWQ